MTPTYVGVFWKSAVVRCEAAVLAGFLRQFDVLPARFGVTVLNTLTDLSRGEHLCAAMEAFCTLRPETELTIEHAVTLLTEWVRELEIEIMPCPQCQGLMLRDRLRVGEILCGFCAYERHAGVSHFAVKARGGETPLEPVRGEGVEKQALMF